MPGLFVVLLACETDRVADFSACEGLEASSSWTETDSAGITIFTADCHIADQPLGWSVDPDPEWELGKGSNGDEEFDRIRGVAALPGGGVAVLDGGSRELRYFDSEGRLIGRFGGQGSGPGEFESPFLVPAPLMVDSLLVFDPRLQRFTSHPLHPEGTPTSVAVVAPLLRRAPAPTGIVGSGLLIEVEILVYEVVQQPGVNEQERTVHWVDLRTGEETQFLTYATRPTFTAIEPSTGRAHARGIPFSPTPSAAVSRTGALVTSGAEFEILRFDPLTGQVAEILRLDRRRRPVTRTDFEAYKQHAAEVPRIALDSWNGLFSGMVLPDSMPAFTSLRVDKLGWLWAQLYDWDTRRPSVWLVFDPDGRPHGTVALPSGLTVHEIGEDYVLGTWFDELRVEYVRRHVLRRSQGP